MMKKQRNGRQFLLWMFLSGALLVLTQAVLLDGFAAAPATFSESDLPSVKEPSVSEETTPSAKIHRVKKGETLWDIAQMYQLSVQGLMRENHLRHSLIFEAQELIIEK